MILTLDNLDAAAVKAHCWGQAAASSEPAAVKSNCWESYLMLVKA